MLAYSFQEKKSTLLALIWGHFTGKQHQILPTRLSNLKKKIQPTCLFQSTCLLESWEYSSFRWVSLYLRNVTLINKKQEKIGWLPQPIPIVENFLNCFFHLSSFIKPETLKVSIYYYMWCTTQCTFACDSYLMT